MKNLYWEAVKNLPLRRNRHLQNFAETRYAFCRDYSWAIPNSDALKFVAHWLGTHAVEMGAGTGYWASLSHELRVEISCFDIAPPDRIFTNPWHSRTTETYDRFLLQPSPIFYPIDIAGPEILSAYPNATLFLCWPPYNDDMALNSLTSYRGRRLVSIGELKGGCTANDAFFDELEKQWQQIATHDLPYWDGSDDHVSVFDRKSLSNVLE